MTTLELKSRPLKILMNVDSELLHIDKVLKEKIDVKMKHDEFVCQKEFKKNWRW